MAGAVAIPTDYALQQNFPNPFNPSTKIALALPEAGELQLMIYDLQGNVVKQLARGKFAGGRYEMVWEGRNRAGEIVAGGVYLYRLTVQPENGGAAIVMTKKLTFLK